MRTTFDLPDELFRQVKAAAAAQGLTNQSILTKLQRVIYKEELFDARPYFFGGGAKLNPLSQQWQPATSQPSGLTRKSGD